MQRNHALVVEARSLLCAALTLQKTLYDQHRIEVPVMPFPPGKRVIRVSAQLHNSAEQYALLAATLAAQKW